MTRLARCDMAEAVSQDMIQSAFGGEPIAPEDCYTRVHITARTKALAMAEWAAMDNRGNLPADWPERRAEIEAQFELKEGRHG